jgi:flagellar hook-associated protein FlgK
MKRQAKKTDHEDALALLSGIHQVEELLASLNTTISQRLDDLNSTLSLRRWV